MSIAVSTKCATAGGLSCVAAETSPLICHSTAIPVFLLATPFTVTLSEPAEPTGASAGSVKLTWSKPMKPGAAPLNNTGALILLIVTATAFVV